MYLFVEWIEIENFMGGTMRIEFSKKTDISGANGTGKSRIKDALSYLLTGKNALNQANFPIKDTERPEMNILPHRCAAGFARIPGEPFTLEKIYAENWSSVQGSAEKMLKGHTVTYKVDGTVMTAGAYEQLVDTMIPTNLLKMLSDPFYFAEQMDWKDQRDALQDMAKEVNDEYVIDKIATPSNDYAIIVNILNSKQSLIDRKSRVKYEIAELRKRHTPIKPKIEENTKHITDIGVINDNYINRQISALVEKVAAYDDQLNDRAKAEDAKADQTREIRNKLNKLKDRQQEIQNKHESEHRREVSDAKSAIKILDDEVADLKMQLRSKTALHNSTKEKRAELSASGKKLMEEWKAVNAQDFPEWDESNFVCSACNRRHETNNIEAKKEELRNHFVETKRSKLLQLDTTGKSLQKDLDYNKSILEATEKNISILNEQLATAEERLRLETEKSQSTTTSIVALSDRLSGDKEYQEVQAEIIKITEQLALPEVNDSTVNYDEIRAERTKVMSEIDALKLELSKIDQIQGYKKRNEELAEEEKALAQQIASYEQEEMLIDKFQIEKSHLIEETVRSKFEKVSFKMFKTNIGDDTQKPTCELWFEGKPWNALNYGSKMRAGLDIINALSNHYNIYPPILLDNRESVHDIPEVRSQIINFFVDKEHTALRVENNLA